jgi:MFS family permease
MGMKTQAARIINHFGFRSVLVTNAVISTVFLAACAAFTPGTPVAVILATLLVGGFFRSLQFTAINTLAYADIDARRMSRATSLASVGQQLSLSAGVAAGALAVDLSVNWRGESALTAADFAPAFLVVAAISAASAFVFARLSPDAGAEMSGRKPVTATETSDQRIG